MLNTTMAYGADDARPKLAAPFQTGSDGHQPNMLAAGIALLVIGVVLGFLLPPFGFVVAAVGLVFLVLFFVAGRRATEPTRR